MADLHRRTGPTAHLSVLADTHVLHIERFGKWPNSAQLFGRWVPGSPQDRVPQAALLLAQMDESAWPDFRYAVTSPYGIQQPSGVGSKPRHGTRPRRRVAFDTDGCEQGVTVAAAPIGVHEGGNRFALSLCGPTRSTRIEPVAAAVHSASSGPSAAPGRSSPP